MTFHRSSASHLAGITFQSERELLWLHAEMSNDHFNTPDCYAFKPSAPCRMPYPTTHNVQPDPQNLVAASQLGVFVRKLAMIRPGALTRPRMALSCESARRQSPLCSSSSSWRGWHNLPRALLLKSSKVGDDSAVFKDVFCSRGNALLCLSSSDDTGWGETKN